MIKQKTCLDCGKDISGTHSMITRCNECYIIYRKEYHKQWNNKKENKEKALRHRKKYYGKPEVKVKRKEYMVGYRKRPEAKENKRNRERRQEYKQWKKEYNRKEDVIKRRREYHREYDKEYGKLQQVKEKVKIRNYAKHNLKEHLIQERGKKCEICKKETDVQVHHKEYTNNVNDLILLCRSCHNKEHSKIWKGEQQ